MSDQAWYPTWHEALNCAIDAGAERISLKIVKLSQLIAELLLAALIGGSPIWAAERASIRLVRRDAGLNPKARGLIADFMPALQRDVGQSSKFSILPLLCEGQPCAMRGSDPSNLLAAAREVGAKFLPRFPSVSR